MKTHAIRMKGTLIGGKPYAPFTVTRDDDGVSVEVVAETGFTAERLALNTGMCLIKVHGIPSFVCRESIEDIQERMKPPATPVDEALKAYAEGAPELDVRDMLRGPSASNMLRSPEEVGVDEPGQG